MRHQLLLDSQIGMNKRRDVDRAGQGAAISIRAGRSNKDWFTRGTGNYRQYRWDVLDIGCCFVVPRRRSASWDRPGRADGSSLYSTGTVTRSEAGRAPGSGPYAARRSNEEQRGPILVSMVKAS